jgi:hypothetical protein
MIAACRRARKSKTIASILPEKEMKMGLKRGLCRIGVSTLLVGSALWLAAAAAGCDQLETETVGARRLNLVYLAGMGGSPEDPVVAAATDAPGEAAFDFGSLKGSRDFYFILENTGESAIENVVLTSSNPAFAVMPSAISVIEPASGDSADVGLLPVVRIGVNHGTSLEGVGFTELLPPGENVALITISGTTAEDDEVIDVGLEVTLTVDAQILDLDLFCDEELIEFETSDATFGTIPYGGMQSLPGYFCDGQWVIMNTGTVDFTVQSYDLVTHEPLETLACAPEESIAISDLSEPESPAVVIEIDGDNTVSDGERHIVGNNGNIYFVIGLPTSL